MKNNILKSKFIALLMASLITGLLVGCANNQKGEIEESTANEEQLSKTEEALEDTSMKPDIQENSNVELPAYTYPGPEVFYTVVYDKVLEFAKDYEKADVSIPVVQDVYLDESDNSDIKYYAIFEIYNYNLDGTTLMIASGGQYPGVMHSSTDETAGYKVDSIEIVEDGSNFEPSAKRVFGDKYDAFIEKQGNSDERQKLRAQIIANYVFANNLDITSFQDSGWDPVDLPEQNIDSFYSKLD